MENISYLAKNLNFLGKIKICLFYSHKYQDLLSLSNLASLD